MNTGTSLTFVADTHTHTLACDHAFSTMHENIAAAKERGLKFLCMTEHAPMLVGSPSIIYFSSILHLPCMIDGVILLKGAEVNIHDYEGALDLSENLLQKLDWVIASMHLPTLTPSTVEAHTSAWLAVAKNPLVDVIGHAGDGRYVFDYEPVIRAFADNGKIVEINAHSFTARKGSAENCVTIAKLCARYGVQVVVSSDAHIHTNVGRFDESVVMLKEIDFPRELILNADYDRFLSIAREKSKKTLTEED